MRDPGLLPHRLLPPHRLCDEFRGTDRCRRGWKVLENAFYQNEANFFGLQKIGNHLVIKRFAWFGRGARIGFVLKSELGYEANYGGLMASLER